MRFTVFALVFPGLLVPVPSILADAFLLRNGAYTTIDVPGADPGTTSAAGINDFGQIVGSFSDSTGSHGFLDTNGLFTRIDFPGSSFTEALGINSAGQIVGLFDDAAGRPQAFSVSKGIFSILQGPFSGANAINGSGQIVGSRGLFDETGFVYANGDTRVVALPFGDVLFSEGHGINDSGQVVGVYFTPGGAHGFLDSNGVFSTIDVPGAANTYSYGINNSGQIVGFYQESAGSQQFSHGYLYTNGFSTTLNVPGSLNTVANGINNVGEIVGSFTPISGTPVPEPGSPMLLVSGLIIVGFLLRRTQCQRTRERLRRGNRM